DGRLGREPVVQRTSDVAPVLVDERQHEGTRAPRPHVVELREREAGHGDHDHRGNGEEDEADPVARHQPEVLGQRRAEDAEHQAASPASRSARPVSAKNASARVGSWSSRSTTSPSAPTAAASTAGSAAASGTSTMTVVPPSAQSRAPGTWSSQPGASGWRVWSVSRGVMPRSATSAAGVPLASTPPPSTSATRAPSP